MSGGIERTSYSFHDMAEYAKKLADSKSTGENTSIPNNTVLNKVAGLDGKPEAIDTATEVMLREYFIPRIEHKAPVPRNPVTDRAEALRAATAVYGEWLVLEAFSSQNILERTFDRNNPDIAKHRQMKEQYADMLNEICRTGGITKEDVETFYRANLAANVERFVDANFNTAHLSYTVGTGGVTKVTLRFLDNTKPPQVELSFDNDPFAIYPFTSKKDFLTALTSDPVSAALLPPETLADISRALENLPAYHYAGRGNLKLVKELKDKLTDFLLNPSRGKFDSLKGFRGKMNKSYPGEYSSTGVQISDKDVPEFLQTLRSLNSVLYAEYAEYIGAIDDAFNRKFPNAGDPNARW